MKYIFAGILFILFLLLLYWIRKAYKSNAELRVPVIRLLVSVLVITTFMILYLLVDRGFWGRLMVGCYLAGLDWLLLALISFTAHYTKRFEPIPWMKNVFFAFAGIDGLNLIVNAFTKHVFTIEKKSLAGMDIWVYSEFNIFFWLHTAFCMMLVVSVVLTLFVTMNIQPSAYRRKYRFVLLFVILCVVANMYSLFMKTPFDWLVFFIGIVGMSICYQTIFFVPHALIDRTLGMVVESIDDAIVCFDIEDKYVFSNSGLLKTFGKDKPEEIQADFDRTFPAGFQNLSDDYQETQEMVVNGEERTIDIHFHKLYDDEKKYMGCFFSFHDKTEEINRFERELYSLRHDKLTDVYNRETFLREAEKKLKDNPNRDYVMICSNIRGFKIFNEMFGEKMGDEVLKMEGGLLRKYTSSNSVFGRISSDEFAILADSEHYSDDMLIYCVNAMREKFNNPQYRLHVYVGTYKIADREEPVSFMCDKCRLAIESHKGDYNTIIIPFDDEILKAQIREKNMIGEFDKAVENDEFHMFLQPQFNSKNEMIGAEALVRWIHPVKGLVPPIYFIPVFEKTGLICKMDRIIWEEAAKKLAEWKAQGITDRYISVNISPKDFYYMDVCQELVGLVKKYDISPKVLKLELTETALVTSEMQADGLVDRLKANGFIVEMDDFGSGYSSLNMLKNIPVDVVKVDMKFLEQRDDFNRGMTILDSVINLINKMGMEVVTEGVETPVQVEQLKEMGCGIFQGYYFAKPMSIEDFEKKFN